MRSWPSLACYQALSRTNPAVRLRWLPSRKQRLPVRYVVEDDMLLLQAEAQSLNICARSIQDATMHARSRAVLGIGPVPACLINQVTGKLRTLSWIV
ncbi:hypothetical protein BC826DRAFT_908073 [Russula brevipes]|nr:hypothetical protein BC826DRAFT_908073 [Russula brevipes]